MHRNKKGACTSEISSSDRYLNQPLCTGGGEEVNITRSWQM